MMRIGDKNLFLRINEITLLLNFEHLFQYDYLYI